MVGIHESRAFVVRIRNKQPVIKRLAQIFAGVNILLILTGFSLGLIPGAHQVDFSVAILSAAYNVLAVLILSRDPKHTVGWLFLLVGFFSSLSGLEATTVLDLPQQFYEFGLWIGEIIWLPVYMIPITLVLQFFPDGHLPSRRWWPVTLATIIGMLGLMTMVAFSSWEVEASNGISYPNPFEIEGNEALFAVLETVSTSLLGIGMVGSLVMVAARFRKSKGIRRAQMKWLVYTALLGISIMIGFSFFGSENPITIFLLISMPIFLAIAMSMAILRYRLFDIDLIIRRTLQYTLLTGLLALIYFGSVLLLQSLIELFTGEQTPAVTVISTLAIVVLFNPLRTRIQGFIDRRFYRKKYDSERALSHFAKTARGDVDMDNLTNALLGVVQETMQPEGISLWLVREKRL